MKKAAAYSVLVTLSAFSFLNLYSYAQKQPQPIPPVPNGGFEDVPNKNWEFSSNDLEYEYNVHFGGHGWRSHEDKHIIPVTSSDAHKGQYCLLIKTPRHGTTYLRSSFFPTPVHPSALHLFVKCMLNDLFDGVNIDILLYKNGRVVDSGRWLNTSHLTKHNVKPEDVDKSMYSRTTSIHNWKEIIIPVSNNSPDADSAMVDINTFYGTSDKRIDSTYKNEFRMDTTLLWVDDFFLR